jgi:hypothetical protein
MGFGWWWCPVPLWIEDEMTSSRGRPRRPAGLRRVAVYYALLAVILVVAVQYVPFVRDAVSGVRLSELEGTLSGAFGPGSPAPVGEPVPGGPWAGAVLASLSMLGALAIMVPVTWVYMLTRRHRGYEESVVHTLLILPVAVTGIVMIVQNSVALAFSLAGIVAAVRFRTTLDDTKDAVYVFLAIGVGLACGVQALGVAVTLSLVFNGVVLVLWTTHFGNIYADPNTRAGALGVGDVVAGPASAHTALQVGDPAVLEAASVSDLAEIADLAVRIERHISEERSKKKLKRGNSLFLIHCRSAEAAQAYVEPILEGAAVRWKLVEMSPGPEGHLLIYIARIEDQGAQGAVMDRLRSSPGEVIVAAELRSLQGLKRRT